MEKVTPPKRPTPKAAPLRSFSVTSRPADTRTERDDQSTIYGVRTLADLSKAVLERIGRLKTDKLE